MTPDEYRRRVQACPEVSYNDTSWSLATLERKTTYPRGRCGEAEKQATDSAVDCLNGCFTVVVLAILSYLCR